jgi:periplasmic divalent cation tolerance protein
VTILSAYVVFANAEEAERIGRTVIDERLAACINILGPCRSIYRWQGKVESAQEVVAILKTHNWKADELIERIASLHSHAVPCITLSPIDKLLRRYADWVEDSVLRED